MANVNKVTIIGRLGNDPDLRTMPNGDTIATLSVATSEAWTDKQTGERKEQTEWHRIIFFRRQAEICGQYFAKGSQIYIEGKLKTRKWQDQQGQDRYVTEIIGNVLQMLDSKQDNGNKPQQKTTQQKPPYDPLSAQAEMEAAKQLLKAQAKSQEALEIKMQSDHITEFCSYFYTTKENNGLWVGNRNMFGKERESLYPAYLSFCEAIGIKNQLTLNNFSTSLKQGLAQHKNPFPYFAERSTGGRKHSNVHFKNYSEFAADYARIS